MPLEGITDEFNMKYLLIVFIIMASVSIKLNAFEAPDDSKINDIKTFVNKVRDANKDSANFQYKLEREEILKADKSCLHCPKHLLLTEQINKVVEGMASDPKNGIGTEELVKINRLKFLYYTEAIRAKDGRIDCRRYLDINPDFKPTKFDGQFRLIAEDALRFNAVTDIQYMNPDIDEMVYYYRGEGAEKDIVVQAILTKDGGKFRYYRYTPSEQEKNPYNLPDLESVTPSGPIVPLPAFPEAGIEQGETPVSPVTESVNVKFKAELETRNKYIPSNIHFVDIKMDHEIYGGMKIKGTSDTSLKGNKANMALKNESGDDLVIVDLDTKISGRTEHRVTVPYSIRVIEDSEVSVNGKIQHDNGTQVMTMSIADKAMEYIRSEYRKNSSNGKEAYLFAKDVMIDANETLSLQYGKGEDEATFASLKHTKIVKKNTTLVLDVRLSDDHKHSIFYHVSSKFD